jgi:hypothetical protein
MHQANVSMPCTPARSADAATAIAKVTANSGRLPSMTAVENAPSPGILTMIERGIPGFINNVLSGLSQADAANLAETCTMVNAAMEPYRRDAEDLYKSAAIGSEASVQRLLEKGVPIDWVFNTDVGKEIVRDTALTAAVRNNEAGTVRRLVQSDRFNPGDAASAEALRLAVTLDFYKDDPFRRFIRDDPFLRHDATLAGESFYQAHLKALGEVSKAYKSNILQLLTHGVPITSLSHEQWQKCWRHMWQEGGDAIPYLLWHPGASEHLFKHGFFAQVELRALTNAQLQAQDGLGRTVIHWCAMALEPRGHVGLLAELCGPGRGNPEALDHAKRTPLHYAAAAGNSDATRILLSLDADPNACDMNGMTPLAEALKFEKGEVASALRAHLG